MVSRRLDGREANQLRALSSEQGLLHRCDGSARLNSGNTSVLACVHGPAPPRSAKREDLDRAVLDVNVRPEKGLAGPREHEWASVIRQSLEPTVVLSNYPRTMICVVVQIVNDDGALLSTAINAVTLALLNAGIAMASLPLSVTCAIAPDLAVVLDPTAAEEAEALAVAIQAVDSVSEGILASLMTGVMVDEQFLACAEAAKRGSHAVMAFVRMSVESRVAREFELNEA